MLGHLLASALSFGLVLGLYNVSDELLFKIDWGPARSNLIKSEVDLPVQIKTSVGENYECIISARALGEQKASGEDPFPLNESALLKQLFTANPCSTRIEFYWSYELCHNKHIRQYHEELLPDKSSKMQEYFLGYAENNIPSGSGSGKPPEIALGEFMYPYFPVNYTSGTICDLTKQHRMSTVLYIYFEEILGQIIEVAEVESCRYEVVFATKSLCSNPIYKRRSAHINRISCHPRDDSPVKPLALTELEVQHREMTSRGLSNLAALFDDVNLKNIKASAFV
ncbi:unnamed protein product [Calicophoron daubneyi]|uniref:Endoplasmic reticulum lectin 1 n=1 Tax=Calicophoron daubneyi TaxID=300641 RepID=A0AAV2TYY1_CALDB